MVILLSVKRALQKYFSVALLEDAPFLYGLEGEEP